MKGKNMEQNNEKCLLDLKELILEEEMSHQFYEKAIESVEFIGPKKYFKEMMWEEFNHVKLLKEKYIEMGGSKDVLYKVEEHGGILFPSNLLYKAEEHGGINIPSNDIDTEVVLDIGIKDETESICRYNAMKIKYKDHELLKFFDGLLIDEVKHLLNWKKAQIEYVSKGEIPSGNQKKYKNYRFTADDLKLIADAVKCWKTYHALFLEKTKTLYNLESIDTILSIIKREKEHMRILGDEFLRLNGFSSEELEATTQNNIDIADNSDIDNKEIVNQIINEEKIIFNYLYDWMRKSTNSQLNEKLKSILENKFLHLKQWADVADNI